MRANTDHQAMNLVIIESPYAGDVERNLAYARACMKDSLLRGEAPYASHLLYTQPGILDDRIPAQRNRGILAGFEWGKVAHGTAVYVDLGISEGMQRGIEAAYAAGRPIFFRRVQGWGDKNPIRLDINGSAATVQHQPSDKVYSSEPRE